MKDLIEKSVEELKKGTYPIYIWGGGATAERMTNFYKRNGIKIEGYLISKEFYKPGVFVNGKEAKCLEKFLESLESDIDLLIGHCSLTKEMANKIDDSHIHEFYLIDYSAAFTLGDEELNVYDEAFWNKNKDKMLALREELADEKSKDAFDEFVYQKRTFSYWRTCSVDLQYFERDIICFREDEVFVDCGSFKGETIDDFIHVLKRQGIKGYKKIIAIEPDRENASFIENKKIKNVKIETKGAWDKEDILYFEAGKDTKSRITEKGKIKIDVDTIDNMLEDFKATFIKMDIEGSELKALHGAKRQIKQNRPKLAICVYHRKTDLIDIPAYIKSLNPDYKLYLRSYLPCGFETVLYAI